MFLVDEQEAHKEEERVSKKDISKLNQEDSQIKKLSNKNVTQLTRSLG
tara:strand:+ start:299 stop:442 length:144 start_codon:yes stop_codon:yes gene_type:complete